MHSQ